MDAASNSISAQTPSMAQMMADYLGLSQSGSTDNTVGQNGPHLLAQMEKAFKWLEGESAVTQTTTNPQAMMAPVTTPYSTDGISPNIQNHPMSQFSQQDLDKIHNFNASEPKMSPALRVADEDDTDEDDDGGTVGDGGDTDDDGYGTVTDDDGPDGYGMGGPGEDGNGVVRDHEPIPGPVEGGNGWVNSPAPPPSGQFPGTAFTSASDYDALESANANMQNAKANLLNNPTDPGAQLAFQEAAQSLQLLDNMLTQMSSMFASMADSAIKAMKVNPSS